jgi:electron transfer flavoprotein alpha subunit
MTTRCSRRTRQREPQGPPARPLTAAAQIGGDVHVLVAGQMRPAAEAAAKLAGVSKVRVADADAYAHAWPSRWPR